MESIQSFMDEKNMESALRNAYEKQWEKLLKAVSSLKKKKPEAFQMLSNPFLVKALPSYRKAKKKVLFVGQQTKGWDFFKITLETFAASHFDQSRNPVIDYLQWMYEDFRWRRKWDHTAFWRGVRRLYQATSPEGGDDGFLHTQLVRFDVGGNRPPRDVEDLLQREFNVLPSEIKALSPDVVVFVTGPYYDERLQETFRDIQFQPILQNALVRVIHPELPYHTYRTYHPNYALTREETVFKPVEAALKQCLSFFPIQSTP